MTTLKERLTIGRVIEAIRNDRGATFVRQMPQRYLVEPRELWLPSIHAWCRADGSSFHGDIRHGWRRHYPGLIGRWLIRRAVSRARLTLEGGSDHGQG